MTNFVRLPGVLILNCLLSSQLCAFILHFQPFSDSVNYELPNSNAKSVLWFNGVLGKLWPLYQIGTYLGFLQL